MKFQIPFTFSDVEKIKTRAKFLHLPLKPSKESKISIYLINSDADISREDYISACFKYSLMYFIGAFIIMTTLMFLLIKPADPLLFSLGISLAFTLFIFATQINYPRLYSVRKQKNIEKNLIPALEDMLVQLNSGIPLFSIMVNISSANYDFLSLEFKKAVRKINAGYAQEDVLEEIGDNNPSIYFRRTLWQISNGMRAGSNISIIIKESVRTLRQEQILQLQIYGNKLNPLFMFYMLMAVIMPALAVTFLTVISSLVNLGELTTKFIFYGLFAFVVLIQIMFIGIMKSLRPSLL